MDATYEGWAPDPFEAHEVRYYVDGRPTKLVRDGSVESFDDLPPRSTWPASLHTVKLAEPEAQEPALSSAMEQPAQPAAQ
ncbi:MAG TPA: hypothetical protein VII76_03185, partial [Acidimicrobiales bacterium]